jgi:uncharacterized protein (DUF2141 family)
MKKASLILSLSFLMVFAPDAIGQAKLKIEISNIRSGDGHIIISIFNSPDQFPKEAPEKWSNIKIKKDKLKDKTLEYNINTLPPGRYAIALLDDENKSGDMEYSKLGIPKEGYGFSNDAKPLLSCPPYKKCLFEIGEGTNVHKIKVRYKKLP